MRPSAPAMVEGRCYGLVTYKEEVSSYSAQRAHFSLEGGDGVDLKNLVFSQRVEFLSKVCGGPGRYGHLSKLQEEKCPMTILGVQAPSSLVQWGAR